MRAHTGEWLVVEGPHLHDQRRKGQIIETRGQEGEPPYLVHWLDGHISLFFPGPDTHIEQVLPHHLRLGQREKDHEKDQEKDHVSSGSKTTV